MKIFFASQSFYPNVGGVSTYLLNLSKKISAYGHEVSEIHLRPPNAKSEDYVEGIDVTRVPREPLDRSVLEQFSYFKDAIYNECAKSPDSEESFFAKPANQMRGISEYYEINEIIGREISEVLENEPGTIVHIHDFQLLYLYKSIPRGIPLIMSWHIPFQEGVSPELKDFLVKHLREFDRVIFSSQDYIDAAVRAGLPEEKAVLIYPISNVSLFSPSEKFDRARIRKKLGLDPKDQVILCVQRIDARSSHLQLIRALPELLENFPNTKLAFAGCSSLSNKLANHRQKYIDEVKALIEKLGVGGNIAFIGSFDYFDIPKVYQMADICAHISKMEGFGLAVTEAMAMAKPVIGSRVGGIPLQIEDGKNGILIDPEDAGALTNALKKLLSDRGLREDMGREARRTVLEKFNPGRAIEKHLDLYQSVLQEKNEGATPLFFRERFDAVVLDFDRTFTDESGRVTDEMMNACRELEQKVILSTGRPYDYVKTLAEKMPFLDAVIAENGSILYFPGERNKISLDSEFQRVARKEIMKSSIPASLGDVIISIENQKAGKVKSLLSDIAKHLSFIRNVDEVMILPKGVNKEKGTNMVLEFLSLDPEKVLLFGDAENDIDLFRVPGYRIAVANAHRRLKGLADFVTKEPYCYGVMSVLKELS